MCAWRICNFWAPWLQGYPNVSNIPSYFLHKFSLLWGPGCSKTVSQVVPPCPSFAGRSWRLWTYSFAAQGHDSTRNWDMLIWFTKIPSPPVKIKSYAVSSSRFGCPDGVRIMSPRKKQTRIIQENQRSMQAILDDLTTISTCVWIRRKSIWMFGDLTIRIHEMTFHTFRFQGW